MEKDYDLIVVGAGPAGLTAAVYAARYKLKTLVIGKLYGGMIAEAHKLCNFPSYETITGFELANKLVKQVTNLGINIVPESLQSIERKNKFLLKTNLNEYTAKKVILAIGSQKRKLNVKGEEKFLGKGISYCATCDAAFYKDKTVAVVGGGDAALTAALLLAEYAERVYIIYRRDKFRGEPAWIEQVYNTDKIQPMFNLNIVEFQGDDKLDAVKLDDNTRLDVDGVFIEIGAQPDKNFVNMLNLKNENGYVIVNNKQETSVDGIYAAGDMTNNPLKQAVTACAEGAVAANSAYKAITKKV